MAGPRSLGADEWRAVLKRLGEALPATKQRHVTLIGGVAMALAYGARRTTTDADVIVPDDVAAEVIPAADGIAAEFGLSAGWMNRKAQDADVVLVPQEDGKPVLVTPSVVFEVPSVERMLGMKVARWAGETDIEDAKILLKTVLVSHSDVEDVWSLIGGLVPVAKREQARHNLAILWEMLHEPA
jgi:hypothetical protein